MLDIRNPAIRPYAFEGNFGLEREALRVTGTGRMAQTPHPFPPDHPRIVRDFCENQTEINTSVHPTAEAAVAELQEVDAAIRAAIAPQGERLWTNSNPPPIVDESEVAPARFTGALAGKSKYRAYLAGKYGKRLMAYCGIHVNFSFAERLVSAAGVDRDEFYLHVASQCIKWGWVIVALTAASPAGQYASVRCSEKGYWNRFVPILDFSSVRAYAKSIARYVQDGLLIAPSELYYPVRLKPRGPNSLLSLVERGIDHIEIRCVDLNPLTGGLVDARDIEFVRLFLLWCAAQKREALSVEKQKESVAAFKAAARIDFDWTSVGEVLERMDEFFAGSAGWPPSVQRVLAFEAEKVYHPGNRYAWMEACHV
jgi:glutamate--cysteine ligase